MNILSVRSTFDVLCMRGDTGLILTREVRTGPMRRNVSCLTCMEGAYR